MTTALIAKPQRVADLETATPDEVLTADEVNLETYLAQCADTANRMHLAAEKSARAATMYAVQAGVALLAAKKRVQHGEWTRWVLRHFEGSPRTAQLYIQLARCHEAAPERISGQSIRETVRQLQEADKETKRTRAVNRSIADNLWVLVMSLKEFDRTSLAAQLKLQADMIELRDLLNTLIDPGCEIRLT
jgi:Protein of unknown function (DUF3102)